jgi:hypothetical protein
MYIGAGFSGPEFDPEEMPEELQGLRRQGADEGKGGGGGGGPPLAHCGEAGQRGIVARPDRRMEIERERDLDHFGGLLTGPSLSADEAREYLMGADLWGGVKGTVVSVGGGGDEDGGGTEHGESDIYIYTYVSYLCFAILSHNDCVVQPTNIRVSSVLQPTVYILPCL